MQHSGLFHADQLPSRGVGLGLIAIMSDWHGGRREMQEVGVLRTRNFARGVNFQDLSSAQGPV